MSAKKNETVSNRTEEKRLDGCLQMLEDLEKLKNLQSCVYCSKVTDNIVAISECYHLICQDHLKNLKNCPKCQISLEGCRAFPQKSITETIEPRKYLSAQITDYVEVLRKNIGTTCKENVSSCAEQSTTKIDLSKNKRAKKKEPSDNNSKTSSLKEKATKNTSKNQESKQSLEITSVSNVSNDRNKSLEKRNNKGETALHIACRLGKLDKVEEYLAQGANANTKDNAGWTPLHEVVQNGRVDLVQVLLQHNALINVPGQHNETPLHEAIRYNHKDVIEELVKNGADIHAKNSKGETPAQLAKGELKTVLEKASENIIQTQSVNISIISALHVELDLEEVHVYCCSQYRTNLNKLKSLVKRHSNLHIEQKFTKKVTHVIVDTDEDGICSTSLDLLLAIVNEKWILSSTWISNSNEESLAPFEAYEVIGVNSKTCQGPKNARYNKYKQLPRIFNGCHFYLHNFTSKYTITKDFELTKASLTQLIVDGGGIVLRRAPNPENIPEAEKLIPYHADKEGKLAICSHYIIFKDIYEPMYNMKHLKALPLGWLIECIEKYELVYENWCL